LIATACNVLKSLMKMGNVEDIRPSPLAGQWYPADPQRLARQVDGYIAQARLPALDGEVIAIVTPHAGHVYSGPVAGYAFAAVRELPVDLVAVVSPMHYPYTERLLTSAHRAYETPLGVVPIDAEALAHLDGYLREALGFGLSPVAYDQEHSLEIELPFLQRTLPQPFALLPVMVRDQGKSTMRDLGRALARLVTEAEDLRGRRLLLVASTDLSHFYKQSDANALDREMLRQVEAFSPEGVLRVEDEGRGFACGHGALAAVLWAAQALGADRTQVLYYATSGDVTGDYSRVVGYGAAAILRAAKKER
jgi:AmmeMemoRadiSam system protein B